jgi:hypothetical protein
MKINELAKRVNISKENEVEISVGEITELLEVNKFGYNIEQDKFKKYNLGNWRCTHEDVGYYAYYYYDVFVGYSFQPYRKSNIVMSWVSKEYYESVLKYVDSFRDLDETDIIYANEDFPDTYKIEFTDSLRENHFEEAMYKNKRVSFEVVKSSNWANNTVRIFYTEDGVKYKEKIVKLDELDFLFNLRNI